MLTIHKYYIDVGGAIQMPEGAQPLHVGEDPGNAPCVWCLVDPTKPTYFQQYMVHGTGHELLPESKHVGTWVSRNFVWHLFFLPSQ